MKRDNSNNMVSTVPGLAPVQFDIDGNNYKCYCIVTLETVGF